MVYLSQSVPGGRSCYSISDLIEYGECPVKLEYSSNIILECQEQVWTSMVSECFNWLCSRALTGKFPSPKSFETQFNLLWDKLKPTIGTALSTDLMLITHSRCARVYKFFSDLKSFEVIAHHQNFDFESSFSVIKSSLTIIRKSNLIYSLYMDNTVTNSKLPRMYPVVCSIISSVTKSFLSGYTYIKKPYIIRAQNFSFHSPRTVANLPNVIDNIVIGLNHSKYPVTGPNCKVCNKKSECPWFNE